LIRRLGRVVAIIFLANVLLSACALPIEELWPPSPGSAVRTVYVSLDTWHAMIAFPLSEEMTAQGELPADHPFTQSSSTDLVLPSTRTERFEEWGYAEQAWYLEDRRGPSGALRALFWPTEGVVEVGQFDQVWAERTPQPPSDLFIFQVSEEGYRRLRHHLDATIADRHPVAVGGSSLFYPATRSYHFFHTCHQYAAQSLREAGLPLSPFWAFSRSSFTWQLRRAAQFSKNQSMDASLGKPQ
jgi:hypothetical protein